MGSENPAYFFYGSGRLECYWSERPFRGWVPDGIGGGQATGYLDRLELMGFAQP